MSFIGRTPRPWCVMIEPPLFSTLLLSMFCTIFVRVCVCRKLERNISGRAKSITHKYIGELCYPLPQTNKYVVVCVCVFFCACREPRRMARSTSGPAVWPTLATRSPETIPTPASPSPLPLPSRSTSSRSRPRGGRLLDLGTTDFNHPPIK